MKKLVIVNRAQVSFDPELWRGRNNFPLSIDLSGLAQTGQQEMNCGALPWCITVVHELYAGLKDSVF